MELLSRSLYEELQKAALDLGFPIFGVTAAAESPGFAKFCQWLDQGYAGSMSYLEKRRAAYQHPSNVLKEVRTLVMLGMPYQPATSRRSKRNRDATAKVAVRSANVAGISKNPYAFCGAKGDNDEPAWVNPTDQRLPPGAGQVATYATGTQDYHDLIHQRLQELSAWFLQRLPDAKVRGVVDTAPLLEREFSSLAGLGWVGKNTLLLNKNAGSYFFLAALLTDVEIDHQPKVATDHCGSCTACLDACPTQAFPQPHVLDATRCISYLTIEHRGTIPADLRELIGDWVFGCDVCQQVCPWNRMAKPTDEIAFLSQPKMEALDLIELLDLDDAAFRRIYRKTPLWRTRRVGMQRNAMIVLGNQRHEASLPSLAKHLSSDDETLRQTAAWAIGRLKNEAARSILREHLSRETSAEVRQEILDAIA